MAIAVGACTCSITKSGDNAGCASLEIVDTEFGVRFVEAACAPAPRGDGVFLAALQARVDRDARAARRDGAPVGAMTADMPRPGLSVDGGSYTREGSTVVCEGGAYRRR